MAILPLVIIAIGLLVAALLLQRSIPKGKKQEDFATALSIRGSFIPIVIGKRRVDRYVFGWAGDRRSTHGGGGKGGGGPTTFYENGWHQVTLGPMDKLYEIKQAGKVIWNTVLQAGVTPSGSSFTLPNGEGTFYIYWGEENQPVDEFMALKLGFRSQFPYMCYIVWIGKKLGFSAVWPKMSYVVESRCVGSSLVNSDAYLDDGNSTGINAAHALLMLMNGAFPHGRGIPVTQLDNATFEEFGVRMQTEHLPINMLIEEGQSLDEVIGSILQDMGYFMVQIGKRLAFIPLRPAETAVPVLDDNTIMPPDIEREIDQGDDDITRTTFPFKTERLLKYREVPITFDDDAEAGEYNSVSPQNFPIVTVTNNSVAHKIARRRWQELTVQNIFRVMALRGARQFVAGQLFNIPGFGRIRIQNKKFFDDSRKVELEVALDSYGVPDIDDEHSEHQVPTDEPLNAEPDIAFTFFEAPLSVTTQTAILVLRTRAHQQIIGANVWVTANRSNYSLAGNQDYPASGGLLLQAIGSHTTALIPTGPIFEAANLDIAFVLDLSSSLEEWQSGRQIAVVDDEVFFLQSISVIPEAAWAPLTAYSVGDYAIPYAHATGFRYKCVTAGTTANVEPTWPLILNQTKTDGSVVWEAHRFSYRMNNMVPAKFNSLPVTHTIGARVFIADTTQLSILTHPAIQPGVNLGVKTVPFTDHDAVDIATVTPVFKPILGNGGSPPPAGSTRITSNGDTRVTSTGDTRITS